MKKLILLCIPFLLLNSPISAMNPGSAPRQQSSTTWEKIAYNGSLFAFGALTTAAAGVGALVADKYLNGRIPASKVFSSMLAVPSLLVGLLGSAYPTLSIAKLAKDSARKKGVKLDNPKMMLVGAAAGAVVSGFCFYTLFQK